MSAAFEQAWTVVKTEEKSEEKSEEKGKFQGYSRNTISGRPERQAKNRAWNSSRKVQRGRTRMKYARNKTRGNVRPKMRRQLGAGGERKEVSKADTRPLRVGLLQPQSLTNFQAPQMKRALRTDPMRGMELFSGGGGELMAQGGWLADMMRREHEYATSDWGLDSKGKKEIGISPTFKTDVMDLDPATIVEHFGGQAPDVLFASPTCLDMSTQAVGSKWVAPEGYGEAAKLEAMQAREKGEGPPDWMGESTTENPYGNWEMLPPGTQHPETGRAGSNKDTAKLMARTMHIIQALMEENPEMYSIVENPVGLARYMPMTFLPGIRDMASVTHASYTDPAAGLFGIPPNVDPNSGIGLDPLETSAKYMGNTSDEIRYGHAKLPSLKRTDFFGNFPPGWEPRPRVSQLAQEGGGVLDDTGVRFNDWTQDPHLRHSRLWQAPPDFLREIMQEGFRTMSPRQLSVNSMRMQPARGASQAAQVGGPGPPKFLSGPLGGSAYAYAPAGSKRGVNQTTGFSFVNAKGEKVRMPDYHARSIIPFQMGTDFARAAEAALNVEAPHVPETAFHREDPNETIRSYMEGGGIRDADHLRRTGIIHPQTIRWFESLGLM